MTYEYLINYLATRKTFAIAEHCFAEQLAFISDQARFKTACCSRRAGKSIGIAYDLLDTANRRPGTAQLYLTLSRLQAKRILWEPLKKLNDEHKMGGEPNETELYMKFPSTGSVIYLSGAKDASEVSKYLGFPLIKVYIDEAQSFRAYLQTLVDDVLAPTLYDYAGTVSLTGTPAPVPAGYFYETCQNPDWAHHHWTMFQNPWLRKKSGRDPMELVLEDCKRMGVGLESPRIQRNCFGKWVVDSDSLVLHWTKANHFEPPTALHGWQFVIGVDLGFEDADAIAVIGWPKDQPKAYLIAEDVRKKQGITELAERLDSLVKTFKPQAMVMDTGGLGKKIAEELRKRYTLPIKAAEKSRKFEYLEILDDALRTQRFYAAESSKFAQDSFLVEWDKDKTKADRRVISDVFHSDIIDAVLYGYREALHWLFQPPAPPPPKFGTPDWMAKEEREMEQAAAIRVTLDDSDPANWQPPEWE